MVAAATVAALATRKCALDTAVLGVASDGRLVVTGLFPLRGCACCDCLCASITGPLLDAAKLCYVRGSAWFTTQEIEKQWGDDWNDAPYEHNAGRPYDWRPDKWVKDKGDGTGGMVPNDEPRWELIEIPFSVDLEEPDWHSRQTNSPWSVEQINRGATPWLISPDYAKHAVKVWAGTPLREFIAVIESLGGRIWLPLAEARRA